MFFLTGIIQCVFFTVLQVREWYGNMLSPVINNGVDFFLMEDGHSCYSTYPQWVQALSLAMHHQSQPSDNQQRLSSTSSTPPTSSSSSPSHDKPTLKEKHSPRLFALTKGHVPGQQRHGGVAVKLSETPATWKGLQDFPGRFLQAVMTGAAFIAPELCIGELSDVDDNNDAPALLTRWYQAIVFTHIMQVQSHVPRWNTSRNIRSSLPFSWPEPYASSMRKAIHLRYHFIPTLYSLAHRQYHLSDAPMIQPLAMAFPSDVTDARIVNQWLVGGSVMTVPVLNANGTVNVYFPREDASTSSSLQTSLHWYEFNTTTRHASCMQPRLFHVPINEQLIFVREGTIVPIASVSHSSMMSTADIAKAPLHVHIYASASNQQASQPSFILYEDDGISNMYTTHHVSEPTIRITHLSYDEVSQTFSWYRLKHMEHQDGYFKDIIITVFTPNNSRITLGPVSFTDKVGEINVVQLSLLEQVGDFVVSRSTKPIILFFIIASLIFFGLLFYDDCFSAFF